MRINLTFESSIGMFRKDPGGNIPSPHLWPNLLLSRDDAIHQGVQLQVHQLAGGISEIPCHDLACAVREGHGCRVVGDQTLHLAVVENCAVCVVSQQAGDPFRPESGDGVRGHVDQLRLDAQRPGHRREDLIPGEHLVGGDVECLADRVVIAQQWHKGLGKVGMMGEHPK